VKSLSISICTQGKLRSSGTEVSPLCCKIPTSVPLKVLSQEAVRTVSTLLSTVIVSGSPSAVFTVRQVMAHWEAAEEEKCADGGLPLNCG